MNWDSVKLHIILSKCNQMEFNSGRKATNVDFWSRFYQLEKEYFEQKPNIKVALIEHNTAENYIIYYILNTSVSNYVLVHENKCNVLTLSVSESAYMAESALGPFLKSVFQNR
jgi:hypothetical protein